MNFESLEENFKYAVEHTVIHRRRKSDLYTFGTTKLPYYFVAKSAINEGDTILRKGEIKTEKPSIIMGENLPTFSGFGDEYEGKEQQMSILFGRSFHFPSVNYQHENFKLEVVSKEFQRVTDELQEELDQDHNSRTALLSGPEHCWALSIIIYASDMCQKSAPGNLKEMLERKRYNSDGFPGIDL